MDVMETGAPLVLDGIWYQRKAVGLMEKAHADHDEIEEKRRGLENDSNVEDII